MKTMLRTAILLLAALPLHAADPVIARSGERDITASGVTVTFKDGETIIKEGDAGDVFYIVEKGEVVCSKR